RSGPDQTSRRDRSAMHVYPPMRRSAQAASPVASNARLWHGRSGFVMLRFLFRTLGLILLACAFAAAIVDGTRS
ncbi:hypothetical protein, partial [Bacteroides thetaiotaomicron]|uniref:hypothetical protein n=1 Tax=Bacteroides thetaiotaomicron TaxID=818 RepID=UPI001EDF4750